jgi:hypothetical protein
MPVHPKTGSATGRKQSREEEDFDSEEDIPGWHGDTCGKAFVLL